MPFSFDWFLTIPGMLISFGIILLVIAFIMFLIGSGDNKEKKQDKKVTNVKASDKKVENEVNKNNEKVINEEESESVFIDFSELDKKYPDEEKNNSNIIEINNDDDKVKDSEIVEINIDNSEIVIEEPVKPLVVEEPKVVDIIVNNEEKVIDVANIKVKKTKEKRQIYGGADPLDATRELPKIDVHHVPYSGGKIEMPTPKVERIPDDFAFKPIVEDVKPIEVKEEQKDFKIEPMVDNATYKFSTNVVEIPDDVEQL